MVRRVWGRRGVKVRQRLQLVYEWQYLFLVVDVHKGKLHWCWIDSMKAEMVGAAVKGLKQHTEVSALVWDGAPSHRDQRVRELGMPLVALPPYSPELNPAERVFEEVRRWVEGRVYPAIEDKVNAVEDFLTALESDPDQVRKLCRWDWIDAAIQESQAHIAA